MDSQIKSYVLRAGRSTAAQKRAYDSLAGQFVIPLEKLPGEPGTLFGNSNPVILEIGFGMGIATAIIAGENPEINYLGMEVHRPGIGRLLWEIEERQLSNIRIVENDAVAALEKINDGVFDGIHIFFPDPWPKKRHHKRRLVKRPFSGTLARKLKPGAYLYMVTDWEDYGNWALSELTATPGLCNSCNDFSLPRPWRPRTKFEQKGLDKNHTVQELFFLKEF